MDEKNGLRTLAKGEGGKTGLWNFKEKGRHATSAASRGERGPVVGKARREKEHFVTGGKAGKGKG